MAKQERMTPERFAEIQEGVRQGTGKVWLYEAADELIAEIHALRVDLRNTEEAAESIAERAHICPTTRP